MYQLAVVAPDGEFKIEGEFDNPGDAWERASDMGSRWFFYPLSVVALNGIITDAPENFGWLENVPLSHLPAYEKSITETLKLEGVL